MNSNLNYSFIKHFAAIIICFLLLALNSNAKALISIPEKLFIIKSDVCYLIDTIPSSSFGNILKEKRFKVVEGNSINLAYQKNGCWFKFGIIAKQNISDYILSVSNPLLDHVTIYYKKNNYDWNSIEIRSKDLISERKISHQYPAFYLPDLNVNDTLEIYLNIEAELQFLVPIQISKHVDFDHDSSNYNMLIAIYLGIMLFMFLYNLFVYLSVKDKNYLFYVIYVLFIAIAQSGLSGFFIRFVFEYEPDLNTSIIVISSVISGIGALSFASGFLNLKHYSPFLYKGLFVFYLGYISIFFTYFSGYHQLSFKLLDYVGLFVSIYALIFAVYVSLKNYRPAKFFLLAWSVFILALILYILKDFSILPSNLFTNSSLQWGSAIESLLLSFALADKINIFRIEKEIAQKEALESSHENERIVKEQNIILESKVVERTMELKQTNTELGKTLDDLKSAQSLLVESEKMASLGQLTAGIAHEINNPINFVTSNIKPLKRDVDMLLEMLGKIELLSVQDLSSTEKQGKIVEIKSEIDFDYLKTEIDYLLKGIKEGSSRTAEIVKGLRVFSRLDEDDLKSADINEGIDSTITILNNLLNTKIEVKKEYGSIPLIDCYPGKLNQVFLNIILNAIQAIKTKFGDNEGGIVKITTKADEEHLFIIISDNGTGMTETTKQKLYEPFYTTKKVGEGTGLGLSIVYNILKKHNGNILVHSTLEEGTEFIIQIPLVQQLS